MNPISRLIHKYITGPLRARRLRMLDREQLKAIETTIRKVRGKVSKRDMIKLKEVKEELK